jgi:hypothetical protein
MGSLTSWVLKYILSYELGTDIGSINNKRKVIANMHD